MDLFYRQHVGTVNLLIIFFKIYQIFYDSYYITNITIYLHTIDTIKIVH